MGFCFFNSYRFLKSYEVTKILSSKLYFLISFKISETKLLSYDEKLKHKNENLEKDRGKHGQIMKRIDDSDKKIAELTGYIKNIAPHSETPGRKEEKKRKEEELIKEKEDKDGLIKSKEELDLNIVKVSKEINKLVDDEKVKAVEEKKDSITDEKL